MFTTKTFLLPLAFGAVLLTTPVVANAAPANQVLVTERADSCRGSFDTSGKYFDDAGFPIWQTLDIGFCVFTSKDTAEIFRVCGFKACEVEGMAGPSDTETMDTKFSKITSIRVSDAFGPSKYEETPPKSFMQQFEDEHPR